MKTCPKCGELVGDNVDTCFNCGFVFRPAAGKRRNEDPKARYEYHVEKIVDAQDGSMDVDLLQNTLDEYARQGWRLCSTITNELGKNRNTFSQSGTQLDLSINLNTTMDEVILIFERPLEEEP